MRGLLLSQKTFFFSEGIKKLVQRWKKCIEKQGDYVEKLCYPKFSIFIEITFVSVVRIINDSPTYPYLQLIAKLVTLNLQTTLHTDLRMLRTFVGKFIHTATHLSTV